MANLAMTGSANITQELMTTFAPSLMVGVLSAGANVVEKQAKARNNTNPLFANASLWGDVAIGAYAIVNYMNPRGFYPTNGVEKIAFTGAGVALLGRRAADFIGATFLGLPTGSKHMAVPGRSMGRGRMSFRRPSAAVETGLLPRKRQFFSIT
jgi:hypothetical protein